MFLCLSVLCLVCLNAATGNAARKEHRYAVVIGNNSPSSEQRDTLHPLRYADDDAIRMYQFFSRIASEVWLLTVADQPTQRRFSDIVDKTEIPTLKNLMNAVESLKKRIAGDNVSGIKSTVYLYFSGHGAHDSEGVPGLVFTDGHLTRDVLYSQIIDNLNADFVHLLIDACYAEGVVGSRGLFDKEADATQVVLSPEEQLAVTPTDPSRYPGLGLFVSSSATRQSHEWSRLESGVFTHVVLSGLSGLADINGDGEIAYSELYAFTAAANRSVEKELARVDVVATPPTRDQNEPIVDISSIAHAAFLFGDMSRLGHFYVELENGLRYAEGHLRDIANTRLWVPANQRVFIYTEETETEVTLAANQQYQIDDMTFSPREIAAKGSIEAALARGLFSSVYSPEYYGGIVDSSDLIPVPFLPSPPENVLLGTNEINSTHSVSVRNRKRLTISLFSIAAVASGLATTFAILSLRAKNKYFNTTVEQTENQQNTDYQRYGTAAWITGALVPVAITAGILLWPRKKTLAALPPISLKTDFKMNISMNVSVKF